MNLDPAIVSTVAFSLLQLAAFAYFIGGLNARVEGVTERMKRLESVFFRTQTK